jgi:hypothetical protein
LETVTPEEIAAAEAAAIAEAEAAAAAEAEAAAVAAAAEAAELEKKEKSRDGYALRKAKEEAEALRKENEGYKRRDEEARLAKLTDEQRIREERDALQAKVERLELEGLRNKVGAEFKLPPALAERLVGTDEASMRADAADIAKLLPKSVVGRVTNPPGEAPQGRIYKRSELQRDPKLARSPEVQQALREGRISND